MVTRACNNGIHLSTPIKLNPSAFQEGLECHPDREFVHRVVDACWYGINIGYEGPDIKVNSDNWPSIQVHQEAVEQSIKRDVALGRKIGPFSEIPFTDSYAVSPMGAFLKKRSHKCRVVHDLSWPPSSSVNTSIPSDKFTVSYMSIDDVVARIQHYGKGTLMAKLDLQDAYHHCLVRPEDWHLLGTSYMERDKNGEMNRQYYFSTVLPFGLRSAPYLFTEIAHATRLIMQYRGVRDVDHYLDDFITVGPPASDTCSANLQTMLDVCKDVGFAINPSKVVDATPEIQFLGIILDSERFELRISEDRLQDTLDELHLWKARKCARKRDILSLIGKLTFISRVVKSGRSFIRRMIETSKKVKHLHHRVRLDKSFRADVDWWLTFLPHWNGVAMFPDVHWTTDDDLQLYTDASNIAVGAYLDGAWFVELVPDLSHSINWRELYVVVLAAATWGHRWTGKRILLYCDNQCVVQVLTTGTSKSPALMDLVRALFYLSATYQFEVTATWIGTKVNTLADALSRLDFHKFWRLAPAAEIAMTRPEKDVLNYFLCQ